MIVSEGKSIGSSSDGVIALMGKAEGKNKLKVSVSLDKNPGYNFLRLTLDYDKEVLTFTGFEEGSALASLDLMPTNVNTPQGYTITPFVFLYGPQNKNDTSTGSLLTLHFTVKKATKAGTKTSVGLKYTTDKEVTYMKGDNTSTPRNPKINYLSIQIG